MREKGYRYSFRRILAVLLSFILVTGSLELTAFAGESTFDPTQIQVEEGTDQDFSVPAEDESAEVWNDGEYDSDLLSDPALMSGTASTWADLQDEINHASDGDVITLTESITAPDEDSVLTFSMGTKVTLDLQDYKINKIQGSPGDDGCVLRVMSGDVTIRGNGGSIMGGNCSQNGGGICVDSGSSLTLESGAIVAGNNAERGGGIYVAQNASLIIAGGEVLSNTSGFFGGGVYVENCSLNIAGGNLGIGLGAMSGGWVIDHLGLPSVGYVAALLIGLAVLLALWLARFRPAAS